jgi:hypothetical protein
LGDTINAYNIFVGKPEKKRWSGRPRRRWVDNIEIRRSSDGEDVHVGFLCRNAIKTC